MDDEGDVAYQPNPYSVNRQTHLAENTDYPKSVANPSYAQHDIIDDDDDDEDGNNYNEPDNNEDDDDDDDDDGNGVQRIPNDDYEQSDYYSDLQRHPKKKKLKTLISSYEFAPRVPKAPSVVPTPPPKPSYGGRNPLTDWTEYETMILLDAWGERFLKQGRKSLRSEEWQEVSEKVSQESRIERTDTQCRNRLDTLKKKYKKEKMKFGDNNDKGFVSEWVYFKKMDALLSVAPAGRAGLLCGLDSGGFVFVGPGGCFGRPNGLDGTRDSPRGSESTEDGERVGPITALRYKRAKRNGKSKRNGKNYNTTTTTNNKSFKLLADSFRKFSDIYEKIEHGKRQQMVELEKMRMDFHRDLEMQKRKILERAQAEIARIRQGEEDEDEDDDDNNVASAGNVSG